MRDWNTPITADMSIFSYVPQGWITSAALTMINSSEFMVRELNELENTGKVKIVFDLNAGASSMPNNPNLAQIVQAPGSNTITGSYVRFNASDYGYGATTRPATSSEKSQGLETVIVATTVACPEPGQGRSLPQLA